MHFASCHGPTSGLHVHVHSRTVSPVFVDHDMPVQALSQVHISTSTYFYFCVNDRQTSSKLTRLFILFALLKATAVSGHGTRTDSHEI